MPACGPNGVDDGRELVGRPSDVRRTTTDGRTDDGRDDDDDEDIVRLQYASGIHVLTAQSLNICLVLLVSPVLSTVTVTGLIKRTKT